MKPEKREKKHGFQTPPISQEKRSFPASTPPSIRHNQNLLLPGVRV